MKKTRYISCLFAIMILIVLCLSGCYPNQNVKNNSIDDNSDELRTKSSYLAYKSNTTEFNIDNVALTFYYGSERSGPQSGSTDFTNASLVTYLYFANDQIFSPVTEAESGEYKIDNGRLQFKYADGISPKNMYESIKTDRNIFISKTLDSAEGNSFYKTTNVRLLETNETLSHIERENIWGNGSKLCAVSLSYIKSGIMIPEQASELKIPSSLFTSSSGYVFFCMTSYFTDDYYDSVYVGTNYKKTSMLEHSEIALYYTKNGTTITLSSYYL